MSIPRKGLRDIRTRSGSVDRTHARHRTYLKLAVLEMEKARRGKERHSAQARVEDIDSRFREIEQEKETLNRSLAAEKPTDARCDTGPQPATVRLKRPGQRLKY